MTGAESSGAALAAGGSSSIGALTDLGNMGVGFLNYGLQKKMFKYQKRLQREIFQREDNAVQRRKADLLAAGFSPVLAAGSAAGSGATVAVNTPQMEPIPDVSQRVAQAMSLLKMKQDISNSYAQNELIRMQAQKTLSDISVNQSRVDTNTQLRGMYNSMRILNNIRSATTAYDLSKANQAGVSTRPSSWGSIFRDAVNAGSTVAERVKPQLEEKAKQVQQRGQYQHGSTSSLPPKG